MNRDPGVAAAMLQAEKDAEAPDDDQPVDDASMARKRQMHRKPPGKDAPASGHSGLEGDDSADDLQQDTPGRPKSASSRQQTQPRQKGQTGNDEQDGDKPAK
jgi:hypothetical protein